MKTLEINGTTAHRTSGTRSFQIPPLDTLRAKSVRARQSPERTNLTIADGTLHFWLNAHSLVKL
jgi:hypothetical protein